MDEATVRQLIRLNNDFYANHHGTFAKTRQSPWPGWERACSRLPVENAPFRLLDIACGNMRFERYLRRRYPGNNLHFTCVDTCAELHEPQDDATFLEADVLERLIQGKPILPIEGEFEAVVSFGFMHHIPTVQIREAFFRSMLDLLVAGGVAVVSFWQFLDDETLAERADMTTSQGCAELGLMLEPRDRLVGWNGETGAYRYCHSFTRCEIDALVDSVADAAECIDRFEADGRNGALNGYAVLRRR